jgi:hypothetical protein
MNTWLQNWLVINGRRRHHTFFPLVGYLIMSIKLFNYDLMSIWGNYFDNMYDLVAIIHRVVPQDKFFNQNNDLYK